MTLGEDIVDDLIRQITEATKEFCEDQGIEPTDEHYADMARVFENECDPVIWRAAVPHFGI